MSRKTKYSAEEKVQVCEKYLNGSCSVQQICQDFNIPIDKKGRTDIYTWINQYREQGADAFAPRNQNSSYSKEFKTKVVEEYLDGKGSLRQLAVKHNIPGKETLRKWVTLYNSDIELKNYDPKQEVYMAEARRKTSIEERVEIVDYCLKHDNDYKGTAEKYDVSYSQVYSWVKKYNDNGEEGLSDKRGCRKTDKEVDELEKLRRENKRLKRQLEDEKMTVELLKKVKEFERRRYSPKEN